MNERSPSRAEAFGRSEPRKPLLDGPRYKAIGNSKAVPVVRWVGRRLKQELNK